MTEELVPFSLRLLSLPSLFSVPFAVPLRICMTDRSASTLSLLPPMYPSSALISPPSLPSPLRGLYRVHQFSKVEMFVVCRPEDSEAMHEQLIRIEEEMYDALGLHFV